jgi:hypothetical protein
MSQEEEDQGLQTTKTNWCLKLWRQFDQSRCKIGEMSLLSINFLFSYIVGELLRRSTLREPNDFKRNFWLKICKKVIKPTGNAGNPDSLCMKAQKLYTEIMVYRENSRIDSQA